MADQDQVRKDETEVQSNEPEVTELDDQSLEDVPGGLATGDQEALLDGNGNCLC
ncbi:MAG: hypothetical protein ACJ75H_21175 [Thermoanaerobaculia bacterium]